MTRYILFTTENGDRGVLITDGDKAMIANVNSNGKDATSGVDIYCKNAAEKIRKEYRRLLRNGELYSYEECEAELDLPIIDYDELVHDCVEELLVEFGEMRKAVSVCEVNDCIVDAIVWSFRCKKGYYVWVSEIDDGYICVSYGDAKDYAEARHGDKRVYEIAYVDESHIDLLSEYEDMYANDELCDMFLDAKEQVEYASIADADDKSDYLFRKIDFDKLADNFAKEDVDSGEYSKSIDAYFGDELDPAY